MTAYRQYKSFRNRVSSLLCDDSLRVVWIYSQYLAYADFQVPDDVEISDQFREMDHREKWVTQWDLEILAKELALNCLQAGYSLRSLRKWDTFASVINSLKDLQDHMSEVQQGNILIEIYRIAHRQFAWQENDPAIMIGRHYPIFNTSAINEICIDRLGLSVDQVYACGIALTSAYLKDFAINLPMPCEIPALTNDVLAKFLSFSCRTAMELRQLIETRQKYDDSFFYSYNPLRGYPLIRMKNQGADSLTCPLSTLLVWRFTAGLYYQLYDDPRFANAFGSSFQSYIGRAVNNASSNSALQLLPERRYGKRKRQKDSVDWIVTDGDAAIFLECKAKRLSWDAKIALNDLRALEANLDIMATAIVQVYKGIVDYQNDQYPHFPFCEDRRIYPIVVTLENWHIFAEIAHKLNELVTKKLEEVSIESKILEMMPYAVWYAGDLEIAIQVIREIGICPFMNGKLYNEEMKWWEWYEYTLKMFKGKFSRRRFLQDDYNLVFERTLGVLPV